MGVRLAYHERITQKFTGKERDVETGLDYFGARYLSSAQGRFTSPDALGGELANPQSLNRYAYALSNPLRYTDPTGMYVCKDTKDGACTSDQDVAFEKRLAALRGQKGDVGRAAAAYGAAGERNGVTVGFANLGKKAEDGHTVSTLGASAKGLQAQSDVTISSSATGTTLDAAIGHEGSHVADAQDVVKSVSADAVGTNIKVGADITNYQSEQRAFGVSNTILNAESQRAAVPCGALSSCKLGGGTLPAQVPGIVDQILGYAPNHYSSGGQPLSKTNQGGSVVEGLHPTVPQ